MKTMLGGWEDVQGMLAAERAGRTASAAASAAVNVRRCVPVTPRDSARPAAFWQSHAPRQTCRGGLATPPHTVAPESAPPRSRPAARRQPPPLPARFHDPAAPRVDIAAPLPPLDRLPRQRWQLDATCELRDIDLIVLPAPLAVPQPVWGARRGGTVLDPPTSSAGWLRRLRRWLKRRL